MWLQINSFYNVILVEQFCVRFKYSFHTSVSSVLAIANRIVITPLFGLLRLKLGILIFDKIKNTLLPKALLYF
jgi:hypothetical protein